VRFASLASGSRGNALLVEHDATLVMVDCGLGIRALEQRMRSIGREPRDLSAVLITHEHSDHVRGVAAFSRRYDVPIWSTAGTAAAASLTNLASLNVFSGGRALTLGALTIEPFTVPHDAREPCQFTFAAGGRRLGVLTDSGHVTAHVRDRLASLDAFALEFNHDLDALWAGSYPEAIKHRVASSVGHLNNAQAAELLRSLGDADLQWVVALHVSEANNSAAAVAKALDSALDDGTATATHHARQDEPSEWLEIL
jgi:phosphoribosyl 1,2-cyclic phosphodiesterase